MGIDYTASVFFGVPLADDWDESLSEDARDDICDGAGEVRVDLLNALSGTLPYALIQRSEQCVSTRGGGADRFSPPNEAAEDRWRSALVRELREAGVTVEESDCGWFIAHKVW